MDLDLMYVLEDALEITDPLFHIPSERRNTSDEEVAEVLGRTVGPRLERFAATWGASPDGVFARFLEDYLDSKAEGGMFTVKPRPLVDGIGLDTDIGARFHLKGRELEEGPFMYIYAGTPIPPVKRVIEFGMRFGRRVADDTPCVTVLNTPEVRDMTDAALQNDIDLTSVYGSDLDLEGEDEAHISMEPRWGRRAAFTVGFRAKDLPSDLGSRVREVLDSLWEPFLRCSLA